MTLNEIKQAVNEGKKVYWANKGYEVYPGTPGNWLIIYNRGGKSESCIGLTHKDGITMNGKPEQFFIG